MTSEIDLRALIGDEPSGAEREALERTHRLLVDAGPPAELPHSLATWQPRRAAGRTGAARFLRPRPRMLGGLVAVTLGIALFAAGYLAGHNDQTFRTGWSGPMHGTPAAPDANAVVQIGPNDKRGNWPMLISVRGLPKLSTSAYYAVWVTRDGHAFAPCGSFTVGKGTTRVELSMPWSKEEYDGWVVRPYDLKTQRMGPVVLRTTDI